MGERPPCLVGFQSRFTIIKVDCKVHLLGFIYFILGGRYSLKKIIWLHWVIVAACEIQFPNQELNLGP